MSATVYLDVFSGLPNPQWKLSDADYSELLRRLTSLRTGRLEPNFEAAEWGYKGMVIKAPGRPTIRIVAGVQAKSGYVRITNRTFVDVDRSIEPWLLERAKGMVDKYGLTFAELTRARNETPIKGLDQTNPIGFACATGVAFPTKSERTTWATSSSNCYNYANNQKATGALPAVPGPNNNKSTWTADQMRHAAGVKDKLELVSSDGRLPAVCPPNAKSHYVVICLREPFGNGSFDDFHCLRLDKDGRWSHKDGSGPVINHDGAKNQITDLRNAAFKLPMTFVGFFLSTKGRRRIS
jgi:hypothetical protein